MMQLKLQKLFSFEFLLPNDFATHDLAFSPLRSFRLLLLDQCPSVFIHGCI
jgi:hypothetical protein